MVKFVVIAFDDTWFKLSEGKILAYNYASLSEDDKKPESEYKPGALFYFSDLESLVPGMDSMLKQGESSSFMATEITVSENGTKAVIEGQQDAGMFFIPETLEFEVGVPTTNSTIFDSANPSQEFTLTPTAIYDTPEGLLNWRQEMDALKGKPLKAAETDFMKAEVDMPEKQIRSRKDYDIDNEVDIDALEVGDIDLSPLEDEIVEQLNDEIVDAIKDSVDNELPLEDGETGSDSVEVSTDITIGMDVPIEGTVSFDWTANENYDDPNESDDWAAEEGSFYQLEVKYKMEDGWEWYGDYDNKQDAINAYHEIYLKYPEVQLLEVDSEGDDEIYRQRNFDLDAETFEAEYPKYRNYKGIFIEKTAKNRAKLVSDMWDTTATLYKPRKKGNWILQLTESHPRLGDGYKTEVKNFTDGLNLYLKLSDLSPLRAETFEAEFVFNVADTSGETSDIHTYFVEAKDKDTAEERLAIMIEDDYPGMSYEVMDVSMAEGYGTVSGYIYKDYSWETDSNEYDDYIDESDIDDRMQEQFQEALNRGETDEGQYLDYEIKDKDGNTVIVEVSGSFSAESEDFFSAEEMKALDELHMGS